MGQYDDKRGSNSRLYSYTDEYEPTVARRPAPGRLPATARLASSRVQIVYRDAVGGGRVGPSAGREVERAAHGSGGTLPGALRTRLESSLDTDLRGVRIHTDASAASAAQTLGANAYTLGQDIYFGAGKYDPASTAGQRLIAHEVAHTVQQRGASAGRPQTDLEVSRPGDAHETEAEGFAQAFVRGESAPVAPVSRGVVSRQVIHRDGALDYQANIEGSGTRAADQAGVAAAAGATVDILPNLNIPLDHATSRQAFFRTEMVKHLNKGMHGYHGDLAETHAYQSMKTQLDGYLGDIPKLNAANAAYNSFVPSANLATRGMVKHDTLQQQLGFDDHTDFDKNLTGSQKKAIKKVIRDNPALLQASQSVTLKEGQMKAARLRLNGHMQSMASVVTGKAMKEVQKKIDKNKKGQDEINAKIAKVAEIAGYIQQAATYAAAGAGALAPAAVNTAMVDPTRAAAAAARDDSMDHIEAGAGHVNTGTGYLATAVSAAMQLYYSKELKQFASKITQAKGELSTLGAIQASQELASKMTLFDSAKQNFKNAIDAYDAAIADRRRAMAAIGAKADKELVGESKMKKGQDYVSQVMLYMTSVRENRSLISNGMTAGESAQTAIRAAQSQLGHRRQGYQTNYEAHGTAQRVEGSGPDSSVLSKMGGLTTGWMGKADVEKKLLDKQEASAARVMGAAGRGGNY